MSGNKHVAMMSFTGSTRAGIRVSQVAANTLKRVRTELGGKSAALMMPDTDLKKQIPLMMQQLMNNTGQSCNALSRMLVQKDKYDEAVSIAKEFAESVKPGRSEDDKGMGPLVSGLQYDRVRALIKKGTEEARLVTGGLEPPKGEGLEKGYFVQPTVFADVNNQMDIARQEVFGPVLSIVRVDGGLDEACALVNARAGTPLALYVFTTDAAACERVLARCPSGGAMRNDCVIHFGMNVPFGGLGSSGYGSAHGKWSFRTFTHERAFVFKPCRTAFEFGGIRYPPYDKYGGWSGRALIALMELLPDVPPLTRATRAARLALALALAAGVARVCGVATRPALARGLALAASGAGGLARALASIASSLE